MRHFGATGAKLLLRRYSFQAAIKNCKGDRWEKKQNILLILPLDVTTFLETKELCTFPLQEPGSKFTPRLKQFLFPWEYLFNTAGTFGAGSAAPKGRRWLSVHSSTVEPLLCFNMDAEMRSLPSVQVVRFVQDSCSVCQILRTSNADWYDNADANAGTGETDDRANAVTVSRNLSLGFIAVSFGLINNSGGSGDLWNKMQVSSHLCVFVILYFIKSMEMQEQHLIDIYILY